MDERMLKRVHGAGYAADPISVVRPVKLPSRKEVAALLAGNIDLLDRGARVIDVGVKVPSGVPIDILAQSGDGTLCAIAVFDGSDPSWIAHTLNHIRWVEEHMDATGVRATAVVARLSTVALNALGFLNDVPLNCLTVRCFTNGDGRFLALEKARGEMSREASDAPQQRYESTPKPAALKPVELTEAEIADFLGATGGEAQPQKTGC